MLADTQTQQEQAPKQDYHYQVDQQVSVNAFFDTEIMGETVRFQITSRHGSTPEKIIKNVDAAIQAYSILREKYPRNLTIPEPPTPQEPKYQPIDDGGNDLPEVLTFTADLLTVDMHDGKFFFKVKGGKFTQFGVNVWPEVLKAANLTVDLSTVPPTIPNVAGWRADYIEEFKDGKPRRKVTRLLPGKAPF
jgi:hypothetical protein